jgi:molybdenum-dependent DNA-binding transcriptional regulator ModE
MKDKIASLMKEKGYNRTVASAIAYKMQQGGKTYAQQGLKDTSGSMYQNNMLPNYAEDVSSSMNPSVMQRPNVFPQQFSQFQDFQRQPTDVNNLSGQQAYQPGEFTGSFKENNPLPQFKSNGFNYNPNAVDTSKIETPQFAQPRNTYAADSNSGIKPRREFNFEQYDPFGSVSMEHALRFAGQGVAEGNSGNAILGGATALLKGGRNFLGGLAYGKENKRVEDEYNTNMRKDPRAVYTRQQGGKVSRADLLNDSVLIDDPTGGNINIEDGEIVRDEQGNIKEAVGDTHKNGGININLTQGEVLSNSKELASMKVGAKNAKELKDRYNISTKKTDTYADVMKKANRAIGETKIRDEQTELLKKIEANEKTKDKTTKALNDEMFSKQTAVLEDRLAAVKEVQNIIFDDVFQRQEAVPKKGNGELINNDGSPMEVNDSEQAVAQQGGEVPITMRKIKGIQGGVTNERKGEGYYIYYDKLPVDEGFNHNINREFVSKDAYNETVLRTPAYQEYKNAPQFNNNRLITGVQQGGQIQAMAKKYGIPYERALELMQQGGEVQEEQMEEQMSNPQEEQGELNPQEVIVKFAEVTQQDPQAIMEQLQQMQPEAQQQAIEQMMQTLQGGQVVAQQGGNFFEEGGKKKPPTTVDPKYSFYTPGLYDLTDARQLEADYLKQAFVANQNGTVSGGIDPQERIVYQNKQLPYLIKDSGIYDGTKANFSNTGKFQQAWAGYRDSVEKAVQTNPHLTDEQKKNYLEKLASEKFKLSLNAEKNKAKNFGGFDSIYGLETSEKGGFNLPLITDKDREKYPKLSFLGDVIDDTGKVKSEYKDLDPDTIKNLEETYKTAGKSGRDIGLGMVQGTKKDIPAYDYGTFQDQGEVKPYVDNTQGFTPYITPPDPRQAVPFATSGNISFERSKRALEPGQVAISNNLDTQREQLIASGLSPQIQASMMANANASAMEAQNANIASVEQYNAQNQQQVNNMQANANYKNDLMNLELRDKYAVRNIQAKDNEGLANKMLNDTYTKLGYRTQQDNFNRSLANASFENYKINRDGTLAFTPPPKSSYTAGDNTAYNKWYENLPAKEQEAEKFRQIEEEKKKKADGVNNYKKSKIA